MAVGIVVWAFVIGWLLLTICSQFQGRPADWVRTIDVLNIVPRWTFFAPQPGRTDFHLLYREWSETAVHGPWREVFPVRVRSVWTAVWNPEKRRRKAIVDLANGLMRGTSGDADAGRVIVGMPYLAFLNLVSRVDADRLTTPGMRQFALVATEGPRSTTPPRVLVRSEPHAVALRFSHAA